MTVQELIRQLQNCDPLGVVMVWDFGAGGLTNVGSLREGVDEGETGTILVTIEPEVREDD
jgi:phosphoribosylformylglycinamidine (FGAM) synthase-like enzyme